MAGAENIDFSSRQLLPDLMRAWALIGIVLVNVSAFSWPFEQGYGAPDSDRLDDAANFLVTMLFTGKSYALFSLMFGSGLAFQIVSAKTQGKNPARRHFRRMAGLLVLGLLHISFFFLGDILILYAFLGSMLYTLRASTPKNLALTGLCLIALQIVILSFITLILYALETMASTSDVETARRDLKTGIEAALYAYGKGNFLEAATYRIAHIPETVIGGIFAQGIAAMGYFLLGLAIVKKGFINTPKADFWRKCRWFAMPVGLAGNAAGAYVYVAAEEFFSSQATLGLTILTLFAPFSAFGYAGWLAKYAAGPSNRLKTFLARAGTSTLTAYLIQSLILSFVFSAYGFGLYAKLGAASAISIGLATGASTLVFSSLWRMRFARGPMEILLRGWTYG